MREDVQRLMDLHNLDQLIQDAENQSAAEFEKKLGFQLDGLSKLKDKREQVAKEIDPDTLSLYNKLRRKYRRPVVPITDNICLGCFIRQPTSGSTDHESLRNCENCKRFLYELKV